MGKSDLVFGGTMGTVILMASLLLWTGTVDGATINNRAVVLVLLLAAFLVGAGVAAFVVSRLFKGKN